ncbi:type II secretion system F family protein [Herbidospora daliensis]|uniref:type II secretion system F family protein n=1 Tax=Herbidospora daliensis TaxID=295585 RepID=UPI000A73F21E|nr:type II secretion system F family protein [Herbidospora daliensis]
MITSLVGLCAGLAVWVWFGPSVPAVRLAQLTREAGRGFSLPDLLKARRSRKGLTRAWRGGTVELCQAVVAELSAGRTPGEALSRAIGAIEGPPEVVKALRPVARVARDGGDVAAALIDAAPPAGGEGLRRLASCWEVGVSVGGGLAPLVERVGGALRDMENHRQEISAQLAGPRATARLLAGLPVLGLLMAAGLGMQPLPFLFTTLPGMGCLVVGLVLNVAGLRWTDRMVRKAEESVR